MLRKIFTFLFLIIVLGFGAITMMNLMPQSLAEKNKINTTLSQGIDAKGKIVDKKIERIRKIGDLDEQKLFVAVEYDGVVRELPFNQNLMNLRSDWEKVTIGDSVDIKVHPEDSSYFAAPTYTAINPAAIDFWIHCAMFVALFCGVLFISWRLLRARR